MNTGDSDDPGPTNDPNTMRASSAMSTSSSEDSEDSDDDVSSRNLILITTIINAIAQYTSGLYNKQEYHTSMLSGYAWVLELRNGHPDRIRCELGVRHHVFDLLLSKLRDMGYKDSREVRLEEQLSIFLYTSVTGLSTRHVGERFQRANNTIAK